MVRLSESSNEPARQAEGAGPNTAHVSGQSVVVAFNPIAGRRPTKSLAEKIAAQLKQAGLKVHIFDNVLKASEVATSLFEDGQIRAFVGVGGDGTLATQVNHTPPKLPLALMPAGTGNVFAKSLGLPNSPAKLVRAILGGKTLCLDAGRANGTLFLNMVSCGFDAAVASAVHQLRLENRRGGHIGYRSYLRPFFSVLRTYRFPTLSITVEHGDLQERGSTAIPRHSAGQQTSQPQADFLAPRRTSSAGSTTGCDPPDPCSPTHPASRGASCDEGRMLRDWPPSEGQWAARHFSAKWVFVCNLPRYGWGIPIAPGASAEDGLLDCWMFEHGGFWRGLWYALWIQLGGRHRWLRDCIHVKGRRFFIKAEVPVPCQRDGDPAGCLPMEIEVLPQRVSIIVP